MDIKELEEIIDRGEDSQHQFKEMFTSPDSLSSELVAMSNSLGGEMIHADIMPAEGLTIDDLDMPYFEKFYNKRYDVELNRINMPLANLMNNLYLAKDGYLNLTGALVFAKNPENRLPVYIVKAVVYPFNTVTADTYIDSRDMTGKLEEIYEKTITFIMNNIHYVQGNQSVNSVGQPEIPRIVFEELLVNALVHRDYYISAPIKVFVFKDRIEIINPGNLPNNLTIENIKGGNSNVKNPVLASFAYHILPYRGIGSGIIRALKEYPDIDFINDLNNNCFKCIIKRKTLS